MRIFLLTAAAASAVIAPAAAETTGSIGGAFSHVEHSYNFNYDVWSIEGSVFHRIDGPWAVQGQGRYENANYDSGSDDGNYLALHGLYQTDGWTAGLLVGQGGLFSQDSRLKFWGVEGALRLGDWSFDASALDGDYFVNYDRYSVDGKYYFGDNISLGAGYAHEDFGVGDWDDWDVIGEWRLNSLPITITGAYQRWDPGYATSDTWTIGVRWDFGSANLREHDRTAPITNLDDYLGDLRRND